MNVLRVGALALAFTGCDQESTTTQSQKEVRQKVEVILDPDKPRVPAKINLRELEFGSEELEEMKREYERKEQVEGSDEDFSILAGWYWDEKEGREPEFKVLYLNPSVRVHRDGGKSLALGKLDYYRVNERGYFVYDGTRFLTPSNSYHTAGNFRELNASEVLKQANRCIMKAGDQSGREYKGFKSDFFPVKEEEESH